MNHHVIGYGVFLILSGILLCVLAYSVKHEQDVHVVNWAELSDEDYNEKWEEFYRNLPEEEKWH